MLQYKITLYDSNGNFKKNLVNILQNVVDFGETINTGQGECFLRLEEDFATTFYTKGDIVEISIYSEKYPNGLPRYTGLVRGLRRYMNSNGQYIELKIAGIFDFLNDINVTKTYSGPLNEVIDEIIVDMGSENLITNATKILGGIKLKNLVSDTTSVNYTASDENLISILINIFESINKTFFINMKGEIIEEQSEKILIPAGRKGIELEIDEDGEINVVLDNSVFLNNYQVNYPIKILNIESNLNLDGQIIQQIDFNDFKTTLRLGQALIFKI